MERVQYRVAAGKTQQLGFTLYKARFDVDCENKKLAISEASYYQQDGSLVKEDADVVMGDIAVGALGEAVYNKVCNQIKYPESEVKRVQLPFAR